MQPSSRKSGQHIEEVQGLKLTVPLANHLSTGVDKVAPWNTRGWTYQERRLSRRILYFSETQVSFSCQYDFYCEDTRIEGAGAGSWYYRPGNNSPSSKTFSILFNFEHNWRLYVDTVFTYTQRTLSFEYDRLNAFAGLAEVFQRSFNCSLFNGLSVILFHWALLWQTLDPTCRRNTTFPKRSEFELSSRCLPSWSWVGWTGLTCAGPDLTLNTIKPEIRIYTYDQCNGFRPIEDVYAIWNSEDHWLRYRKRLANDGLTDESAHFPTPIDHVDVPAPTRENSAGTATTVPPVTQNHYFLYFCTTYSSTFFSITGTTTVTPVQGHNLLSTHAGRSFLTFWVTDPAGNHVGTVRLTQRQVSHYINENHEGSAKWIPEFILLSRTRKEPYLDVGYNVARSRGLGQEWFSSIIECGSGRTCVFLMSCSLRQLAVMIRGTVIATPLQLNALG